MTNLLRYERLTFYMKDIPAAIAGIESFILGLDLSFQHDDKTTGAVLRKLDIIGEAVKHLSDEIRDKNPHVPCMETVGMRDKLIHFLGVIISLFGRQ